MDWRDEGILTSVRRHGESAAIIEVFTAAHGRHAGLVQGGAGRKLAPILQPGAQLVVDWRARLEDHLGTFRVEPVKSRAALVLADRAALAALSSMTTLITLSLPEREAHPGFYARSVAVMDALGEPEVNWRAAYALWEVALLREMGFGLDFSACAVTGGGNDLGFVSPRSGRAVSRAGAGEWADRLLDLPDFIRTGVPDAGAGDIAAGLRLTGHFLETWLLPALHRTSLPDARARLLAVLNR